MLKTPEMTMREQARSLPYATAGVMFGQITKKRKRISLNS